jgi:hypothetical protein
MWLRRYTLGLALQGRARRRPSKGLRVVLGGQRRLYWGLRVALLGRQHRGSLSGHQRPMVRHESPSGVRHQRPAGVDICGVGIPSALRRHPNLTVHDLPVVCKVTCRGNVQVPRPLLSLIRTQTRAAGSALLLRRVIPSGWRNPANTVRRRQLRHAAVAAGGWLLQARAQNRRRGGLLLLRDFGVPGAAEQTSKGGEPLLLHRLGGHGGLATLHGRRRDRGRLGRRDGSDCGIWILQILLACGRIIGLSQGADIVTTQERIRAHGRRATEWQQRSSPASFCAVLSGHRRGGISPSEWRGAWRHRHRLRGHGLWDRLRRALFSSQKRRESVLAGRRGGHHRACWVLQVCAQV